MRVSVASGKGGTGKTTVALMLAAGAEQATLIDCDVEEPNCHLFAKPDCVTAETVAVQIPDIIAERCDGCGDCAKGCRFSALVVAGGKAMLFPELCHSCGACSLTCTRQAIREMPRRIGIIEQGTGTEEYQRVRWIAGKLDPGLPAGGPLIKALKAKAPATGNVVLDCPPGTSCSMALAVYDSDVCLLVTEPNAFGYHDLVLAVDVLAEIGQERCGVVINKSDPGLWQDRVRALCQEKKIPLLAEIPYSREWAAAYAGGRLPAQAIVQGRNIWREVQRIWPSR